METDPQDAQGLGGSDPRSKQKSSGGVLDCAGKVNPATLDDLKWLKAKGSGLDAGVSWDNLKISDDGGFFSPTKKRDTDGKAMVNSPVSTLAIS